MTQRYFRFIAGCLSLVAPLTSLAQWGGPTKVTVAKVELRELPASTTLVGTLDAVTRSTIGSETAGLVTQMPVRQGDYVRAGQLICRLRDDTASLELAAAQEYLKSLEAAHRKWVLELERIGSLYERQDASDKEVYDTKAEYDQALYAVAQQKAVVSQLETELAKMHIRAPFSGFIVARSTELGQWLTEGGEVVEMADLSSVLVRVDVPERALPYVRVGDAATVKVDALGQAFRGQVRHVILQADAAARTFPVDIVVRNPGYVEVGDELLPRSVARTASTGRSDAPGQGPDADGPGTAPVADPTPALLAGGMFARVTLHAGPSQPTPAVPKDAVVIRNHVEYVSMVTPGEKEDAPPMAIPLPVTTGVDIGDWIAVTSGNLAPGIQVVTQGNESILFPTPIQIVERVSPPDVATAAPGPPAISRRLTGAGS